jgi:hypothetical protein
MKSMALNHSCKPFPLVEASDIHDISGLKEMKGHLFPQFKSLYVLYTEFLQMIRRAYPCLLEMAGERFIHPLAILWKETELKGGVTILFFRLLLDHRARPGFDDGHRYD